MAGKLDGKVAFITGAARGQGRAHALRMAQEGADIIAVDISEPVPGLEYATASASDLQETVRLVEALDRRIVASEADVRDLPALTAAVDSGVAELGRLDIVLANAGILSFGMVAEMDERTWQNMIDINLTGVWKTMRAAIPHIQAGGRGGSVVLTSSTAAIQPNYAIGHYAAAKAGLVMLAQVAAKELAAESIRINVVQPTTADTEMVAHDASYRRFRPDLDQPTKDDFEGVLRTLNALPVGTIDVSDITNAIMFLASDESRYITGSAIAVTAGTNL